MAPSAQLLHQPSRSWSSHGGNVHKCCFLQTTERKMKLRSSSVPAGRGTETHFATTLEGLPSFLRLTGLYGKGQVEHRVWFHSTNTSPAVFEQFSRGIFHFFDSHFCHSVHRYPLGTVQLRRQQQTAHDFLNIAIFFKKSLARWNISFSRDKADAENRKQVVEISPC